MFVKMPFIKRKLKSFSLKVFNLLENNGNCVFESNGELLFINNLFKLFSERQEVVVFDIGANTGEYAQMVLDKAIASNVKVNLHLFEPTKSCFNVIRNKFGSNSNIHLNNFGASEKSENAEIFYDKEQSGLASLYKRNLDSYGLKLNQTENIKLERLDRYIEKQAIKHIDFIKIDIEGHELSAFKGLGDYISGNFVDYIQFEYGGANLDSKTSLMELYDFLTKRNFFLTKVMPNGLEHREYSPHMENFNYANYVAVSKNLLKNLP